MNIFCLDRAKIEIENGKLKETLNRVIWEDNNILCEK